MKKIILASQSPRRKQLLEAMGVSFTVIPSNYHEQLDDSRDTIEVARELSLGKALDVAEHNPDAYVIGSDTIVWIDGKQLGKPADEANAMAMLKLLGGREHYVTTGIAIVCVADATQVVDTATCKVFFKPYDEKIATDYVATGDPMDKAGGYGIQTAGRLFVDGIEGDADTVMGLSTKLLSRMLNDLAIKAHPVELKF